MRKKRLGRTDLELTRIGLGTWAIGGAGWKFAWGPQDDADSIATIIRASELGINWLDTAAVYGLGHSEEVIGRALKKIPAASRPMIATKCGRGWNPDGSIYPMLERNSILRECEASLRRLGVEVIDLYQMHWPQPDEDIEQGWEAMAQLKRQGKVRHIGVSNFNAAQLERIRKIHPVASLQPPYSMLNRDIEGETLAYCGKHGIGVLAYSPMGMGLLTGKWDRTRTANLPGDDHRKRRSDFNEPQLSVNLELVQKLQEIARRGGRTVAQLAVAWTTRGEEVTSAIVGARRPEQVEEIAPAGDWQLSDGDISEIDRLLAERDRKIASL